jgi:hypothetical protein
MFGQCCQYDETLVGKIADRVCDAQVALVLGVVWSHDRENTRSPVGSVATLAMLPP